MSPSKFLCTPVKFLPFPLSDPLASGNHWSAFFNHRFVCIFCHFYIDCIMQFVIVLLGFFGFAFWFSSMLLHVLKANSFILLSSILLHACVMICLSCSLVTIALIPAFGYYKESFFDHLIFFFVCLCFLNGGNSCLANTP